MEPHTIGIRKKSILLFSLIVTTINLFASQSDFIISPDTHSGSLEGTLLLPETSANKFPAALIISGSGPADRDINNPLMANNSLKLLAFELAEYGIASLRYDKRGIGRSASAAKQEQDLCFEHFVSDAAQWISTLKKEVHPFFKWVIFSDICQQGTNPIRRGESRLLSYIGLGF